MFALVIRSSVFHPHGAKHASTPFIRSWGASGRSRHNNALLFYVSLCGRWYLTVAMRDSRGGLLKNPNVPLLGTPRIQHGALARAVPSTAHACVSARTAGRQSLLGPPRRRAAPAVPMIALPLRRQPPVQRAAGTGASLLGATPTAPRSSPLLVQPPVSVVRAQSASTNGPLLSHGGAAAPRRNGAVRPRPFRQHVREMYVAGCSANCLEMVVVRLICYHIHCVGLNRTRPVENAHNVSRATFCCVRWKCLTSCLHGALGVHLAGRSVAGTYIRRTGTSWHAS